MERAVRIKTPASEARVSPVAGAVIATCRLYDKGSWVGPLGNRGQNCARVTADWDPDGA
ncbi:hypothetical protein GCM10010207_61330 [Streptomyces atratus]|nr:hypothetical protein GCM10010207_61330 [Streptomyces atratus]